MTETINFNQETPISEGNDNIPPAYDAEPPTYASVPNNHMNAGNDDENNDNENAVGVEHDNALNILMVQFPKVDYKTIHVRKQYIYIYITFMFVNINIIGINKNIRKYFIKIVMEIQMKPL